VPLPIVPKGTVYHDEEDKRRLESRNGYIQTQYIFDLAANWDADSRLTPEVIRETQRLAVNQIYRCAGHFRDQPVEIQGVVHQPPDHMDVADLVERMCDYVHDNWEQTPIHLASYLMWRMNWIHPFLGGNGRTARAISYLVLCAKLGFVLPGTKMIPDLIVENREPYFQALQSADRVWQEGGLDLTEMEGLLSDLLATQLLSVHEDATGGSASSNPDVVAEDDSV